MVRFQWPGTPRTLYTQNKTCMCYTCAMHDTHVINLDFGHVQVEIQPLVTLWPAPRTLTEQRKTCMCHTCAMHVIHMTNLDCGHVQWKLITHAYTR